MIIKPADRLNSVEEYYFSTKLKEIKAMEQKGVDIINLGVGSPDMAPEKLLISRLIEESMNKNNHAYQSYTGIKELRQAFADFYRNFFNVSLSEDEILPLMGSKEGIMHISMAFLNMGDRVLIPNPGYPTYESVAKLVGAEPVFYNLDEDNGWYPDFDKLEGSNLSKVKIMWVNYPNMPTGAKASQQLFKQLLDFGLKHKILIINDNPYSFILNHEQLSILEAEGAGEVALELNSLSKSHNMAGWRVGMLAGDKKYIKPVLQVKSNMDSGMFKPIQLAAVCALNADKSWYQSINIIYAKRRRIVFDILDKLNFTYDANQVGMFVWARISNKYFDANNFTDMLLEETGIFITPGSVFGSNGNKYVRVSLCTDEERLQLASNKISNMLHKPVFQSITT